MRRSRSHSQASTRSSVFQASNRERFFAAHVEDVSTRAEPLRLADLPLLFVPIDATIQRGLLATRDGHGAIVKQRHRSSGVCSDKEKTR
jgi:hypothetical protein